MKTTILLILTIIMTASKLFAQDFSIGNETGIISSINSDYKVTDFENRRNTYYSGFNFNYKYSDRLSYTAGFHYLRQGYKHETCYIFEDGVKNQLVGKIDYLIIPATVNIHILKSQRLTATFGFYGAYNIKAVQDYPDPIGGCEIYYIEDLKDLTCNFSFGGIAGLGYKIIKNDKLQLIPMIKYYQGLCNSYNNPYPGVDINRKYSSLLITLTFNYNLK